MVIDQSLISTGFPLVGGAAIGFGTGYLLRKLLKLAFIALGLLSLLLGYLEYKHWISVNWGNVETGTSTIMTHIVNKIATITQQMNHEVTVAGLGLLGFAPGVLLGFYKG